MKLYISRWVICKHLNKCHERLLLGVIKSRAERRFRKKNLILAGGEAVSYSRTQHLQLSSLKEQMNFIKKHKTCVMAKNNKTFDLIAVVQLFYSV